MRQEVSRLNPQAVIERITTLSAELEDSIAAQRMAAALTSVFGLLALLLAAVGLYGVMAFAVSRRTREIGIRMAIGAERGDILRLILREGVMLVVTGLAIGLAGALAVTRLVESQLYSVKATDPLTFAAIALLLLLVALAACFIPAWRATRVDPIIALRTE